MIICADSLGIDWDTIGNQCVGYNSFFKSKVFGRVACVDSVNPGLKFLSITAGMNGFANIVTQVRQLWRSKKDSNSNDLRDRKITKSTNLKNR